MPLILIYEDEILKETHFYKKLLFRRNITLQKNAARFKIKSCQLFT